MYRKRGAMCEKAVAVKERPLTGVVGMGGGKVAWCRHAAGKIESRYACGAVANGRQAC